MGEMENERYRACSGFFSCFFLEEMVNYLSSLWLGGEKMAIRRTTGKVLTRKRDKIEVGQLCQLRRELPKT